MCLLLRKRLFKYIENFTTQKRNSDIFSRNIDYGYLLEPPRRGGSNKYPQSKYFYQKRRRNNVYSCKPQFYYIKVGFKGVKII